MTAAPDLEIRDLAPGEAGAAAQLLAHAFADNPINRAAFGSRAAELNRPFFRLALGAFRGRRVVAVEEGTIVGFAHWASSPLCRMTTSTQLRLAPAFVLALGPSAALRVARWLAAWERHDDPEPHWHLGPLAVAPDRQRKGVGGALMRAYCADLDAAGAAGFLETDKEENVEFYESFGFALKNRLPVLSAETFFMVRSAKASGARD